MMKPKRRPVKRENLALKQVKQVLKNVSDQEMKATIEEALNKLGPIDESVNVPMKESKENVDSFAKRLLNFLMRRGPGNKNRKFESREDFSYKAKGGMVIKKINNDMRKSGMFKGGIVKGKKK